MHEMSIAKSLFDIILAEKENHGFSKVRKVRLMVGELSAIVPSSLSFCFEMIAKESMAEGAVLDMEYVPVRVKCGTCGVVSTVVDMTFVCSGCGGSDLDVVSGKELKIIDLEVE